MINYSSNDLREVSYMKWSKVRQLYPNQFVKFKIVESHEDDKYRYVDDVAAIKE